MAKRLKNKKGMAHLEMIISFVIFAVFVFFIIYYLNPIKHQNINNVLFSVLKDNIKAKTEITLYETPIILNGELGDISGDCFVVPSPYSNIKENLAVFNENKEQLGYSSAISGIAIEKSTKMNYVYYSPEQELVSSIVDENNCAQPRPLDSSNYTFSVMRSYRIYSLKKINETERQYEENYDGLKKELNFPSVNDFSLYIRRLGENIDLFNMSNRKPDKIETYAIEIPIQIMDDNGELFQAILNLQVW
jgi:hypothetical protein